MNRGIKKKGKKQNTTSLGIILVNSVKFKIVIEKKDYLFILKKLKFFLI